MVPRAGVEPARPFGQRILSPQRLPFRHPGFCRLSFTTSSISVGYVSGGNSQMCSSWSAVAEFYHLCWQFSQPLDAPAHRFR